MAEAMMNIRLWAALRRLISYLQAAADRQKQGMDDDPF
jgi:hypothetical protein